MHIIVVNSSTDVSSSLLMKARHQIFLRTIISHNWLIKTHQNWARIKNFIFRLVSGDHCALVCQNTCDEYFVAFHKFSIKTRILVAKFFFHHHRLFFQFLPRPWSVRFAGILIESPTGSANSANSANTLSLDCQIINLYTVRCLFKRNSMMSFSPLMLLTSWRQINHDF